ncbi:MAG TPA: single-stranded-DNA-specific exonuclease RecJ [Candidatus Scatavimonas merdigallinarum]|uniref:Single-stranded-DNA-specific exonuclease RecJ n=1 Tax=Candidatus Scatavimonas merdigallinarum TaxID=2840914 RepID=A0A9D0ZH16_9FIRM|nr:single-stranded-DNA-specific exonuclease RecJ [Candidatus Scatavimonas merdigallinarum]
MKKWTIAKLDKEAALNIAQQLGLPVLVAMLLQIRGFKNEEEVLQFLSDEADFSDPFLMADMEKAVRRIKAAIETFEKICVYGDYDADGVTSTALLCTYLESVGANVMYYIPERESEGYGMNTDAIDTLRAQDVTLIITVDNGIAAHREIAYAKQLSVDTVVTDHHMPSQSLPDAVAVVDPHRPDCTAPFKELSGVGVVFKLIMALEDEALDMEKLIASYADLAAIGTIGDIVPLVNENRLLVRHGLSIIENTRRPGIAAVLKEAGLEGEKLTAGRVSFTLVPRINACGRMGLSEKSVRLFLTEDADQAQQIAVALGQDNRKRQTIEKEILTSIINMLTQNPALKHDRILVVDGENWHQGVIGIVASRLKEIYGRPVIVITRNGDMAKGSGRSIKGFSLCDAVFSCSSLLTHYGGHPMAVGISLAVDRIEAFRKAVNEYAAATQEMPLPTLEIDCKLNPAALSAGLAKQLSVLEPYGAGNPSALFGLYTMRIDDIRPVGGGKHLRLRLSREEALVEAMRFACTAAQFPFLVGDIVDIAVTLDVHVYNGQERLSIVIRDIKLSKAENEEMLYAQRLFEAFMRAEALSAEQYAYLTPQREEFAHVYRFLKNAGGWRFGADMLCCRLEAPSINYGKLMVILMAMAQLLLINLKDDGDICRIHLPVFSGKADLETAPIMRTLKNLQ